MRSARLSNDDISRIFSAASQPFSQSVAGWNYSDVAVVGEFRLFSVGYRRSARHQLLILSEYVNKLRR